MIIRNTFPYVLFQQASQLQVKEKHAVEDFKTIGLDWFYKLSGSTITKLLNEFYKQNSNDKTIKDQLDMFEKVDGKYFYSYKEKWCYAYVDENGREKIVLIRKVEDGGNIEI